MFERFIGTTQASDFSTGVQSMDHRAYGNAFPDVSAAEGVAEPGRDLTVPIEELLYMHRVCDRVEPKGGW